MMSVRLKPLDSIDCLRDNDGTSGVGTGWVRQAGLDPVTSQPYTVGLHNAQPTNISRTTLHPSQLNQYPLIYHLPLTYHVRQ